MWHGVNPTGKELDELISTAKSRVAEAVRTVENHARTQKRLAPLNPQYPIRFGNDFYGTPRPEDVCLLNFRAWTLRYGVSIEFLINALRRAWPKRYRLIRRSDTYMLSLKPERLTTVAARKQIEQAVLEEYPNGEQWYALKNTVSLESIPRTRLDPDNPEGFLNQYRAKVNRTRRQQEVQEARRQKLRRQYRKPELEWRKYIESIRESRS